MGHSCRLLPEFGTLDAAHMRLQAVRLLSTQSGSCFPSWRGFHLTSAKRRALLLGESFPLVSVFWVPKEGCPFLPASLRLVDLGLSFGGSPCHIGNKGRLQNSEGLSTSGIAPCGFFRGSSRVLAVFLKGALFWLMFSGEPRLSYPLLDPPYWSCQSCNLLPKPACVVSFRVKLQSRVPKGAPSFLMAKAMLDSLPKTAEIESLFFVLLKGGFNFLFGQGALSGAQRVFVGAWYLLRRALLCQNVVQVPPMKARSGQISGMVWDLRLRQSLQLSGHQQALLESSRG